MTLKVKGKGQMSPKSNIFHGSPCRTWIKYQITSICDQVLCRVKEEKRQKATIISLSGDRQHYLRLIKEKMSKRNLYNVKNREKTN